MTTIIYGRFPEWPKGTDCKSVVYDFGGSNPPPSTIKALRLKCFFLCRNKPNSSLTLDKNVTKLKYPPKKVIQKFNVEIVQVVKRACCL